MSVGTAASAILSAGLSMALCGCVDPAHSRWAGQGTCEVSTGSHMCTDGPGDAAPLTANGDPSLRQDVGSVPGGR